ncbi:hypothetical protein EJ110_NYTH50503 [Nymphaea thermarum]|nr:hypothetical protein EJ110_NYTH50503 [Nymphaea thermarum]
MSCCRHPSKKTPQGSEVTMEEKEILSIPAAQLTLVDSNDSVKICRGEFTILKLIQEGAAIAIIVKVGDDYQWPLTKDEPVVKLDDLHYLFSIKPPSTEEKKKAEFISYGVKFSKRSRAVDALDAFLSENSCFSAAKTEAATPVAETATTVGCCGFGKGLEDDDWKKYAPNVENYHGTLAKAIASGTGEVVKGVFICSNAYRSALQNGSETLKNDVQVKAGSSSKNKGLAKKSLKRVRKMSKMTEKLSHSVLEGVVTATGSITGSMVKSQAGKKFFSLMPGEVLLVTLDAVDKVLEALEVAGKDSLSVTAGATTRMVSERFGEDVGEVTDDVLATAGHALGTAWNVFKIRKAINPASKKGIQKAIMKSVIKK